MPHVILASWSVEFVVHLYEFSLLVLVLDDDERAACALDARIRPVLVQSILEAIH